jgi:4-amino-4-deoxy-L-arabinose transferase-like glycosyltransferase
VIWRWAIGSGIVAGVTYSMSPLTVWFVLAMALLVRWGLRDLAGRERQWVALLLIGGIVARVAAVAGLFLLNDPATEPFGFFFGDEEYFLRRSMWLRNVALDIPIHRADLIYAYDQYSYTHYLYVMALIQALVGFAPYGLHLVGIALFMFGVVLVYRGVRRAYGSVVSTTALAVLLFFPTLFAWSASALKEPPYIFVTAAAFAASIALVRAETRFRRGSAILCLVACAAALQAVREGGAVIIAMSAGGGLVLTWLVRRPQRVALAALLVPSAIVVMLAVPSVQMQAIAAVRRVAYVHWGHINTAGYTYKSLDPRVYEERENLNSMTGGEVGRYAARSIWHYFTAPLPWRIESRATLAALPELVLWYVLVLLAPVGFMAGLKRDALVTCVLAASVVGGAVLVAVTGGNIGTLIRHRSLVMPFMVWLSALGGWRVLLAIAARGRDRSHAPPLIAAEDVTV